MFPSRVCFYMGNEFIITYYSSISPICNNTREDFRIFLGVPPNITSAFTWIGLYFDITNIWTCVSATKVQFIWFTTSNHIAWFDQNSVRSYCMKAGFLGLSTSLGIKPYPRRTVSKIFGNKVNINNNLVEVSKIAYSKGFYQNIL